VLSTGVNLISDVVGAKAKSGAFVFGVYSMIDKIAVGVAIFVVVETEAYSKTTSLTAQDRDFIKWTVILVPGISCLLSAFILSLTSVNEYAKVDE
jgi:Na+/melibiose symporter-like transporter